MAVLLIYEHRLVRPDDLTRVNRAFFNVNAVVSIGLLLIGVADLALALTAETRKRAASVRLVFLLLTLLSSLLTLIPMLNAFLKFVPRSKPASG